MQNDLNVQSDLTDEVVMDSELTTLTSDDQTSLFDASSFEATKAIINRQVEQIEVLKKQIKIFSEQLKDMVENDEGLIFAQKEAKEATQKAREIKANIMNSQSAKSLKGQLLELREDLKDLSDSLSSHLLDLYQTTGVMEFEGADGSVYEYKVLAKLGGKKS